ncbi:branched-chain amino acid ABC transporter permease [Devosia sp.]|uniref:branched-chain amino acid ABC transporter permease n=1 Tax=Devosia sp. TaxID=1871048 RepID=UPI002EF017C5
MFIAFEPILIFTLLNIALTVGLYISNLSGQLSLGTAAVAGIGGYISAVLTSRLGMPFPVGLLAATAGGVVVGVGLGLMTYRMEMFVFKLVTLAFGEAVVVLAFNIDYLGGANSFTGIPLHTGMFVAFALAAGAVLVAYLIDFSALGFAARAVRDDALAASAMGISIRGVRVFTLAVSTGLIALTGAMQAHYLLVINPHDLTFFVSLSIIIFLLFGGMQTLWGAVLGATILTVLPEVLRFSNEYRLILFGVLVVAIVMLRPEGLLTRRPLKVPPRRTGRPLPIEISQVGPNGA